MRGTADVIMSDADARALAENVNRAHPGLAQYVEITGGDHLLTVNRKLAEDVVPTMMRWMRDVLVK
jgi:hypothetical protein